MPEPVRVGDMLALREEFDRARNDQAITSGMRRRADIIVRAFDELLDRREKEAANAAGA